MAESRSLLVVRVNLKNATVPCTKARLDALLWKSPLSVNRFFDKASFGSVSFSRDFDRDGHSDIVDVSIKESVPTACNWTLLNRWKADARSQLISKGVRVDSYQHIVFLMPNEVPCGPGHSQMGCGEHCSSFLRYCSWPDLYAHELAHNLGMNHARTDYNNDGTADSEYGDDSCIMGHSFRGYRHFNAYHKRSMNWITASGERILNASGKYRILATEQNSRRRDRYFGETQLITIPLQGLENQNYYISYRLKLDAFSTKLNVPNQISIHRGYTNGTFSNLIRTLAPSESFVDSTGFKVRFLSAKSPYATVQITLPKSV